VERPRREIGAPPDANDVTGGEGGEGGDTIGELFGVVINRDGVGDQGVDDYCAAEGIPILMRIPLDRRIAEAYSDGGPLVEALPEYREQFQNLYAAIGRLVTGRQGARGQ
jgi:MinD superfamily P-loop ATPase